MEMELHADAGALLSHLTGEQRQSLDTLDAAFIDLMSSGIPAKADVEALADAVMAFYEEIAKVGV